MTARSMAEGGGLRSLSARFSMQGRIEAIILRPERKAPPRSVTEVQAVPGRGLIGDRRAARERRGDDARKREVTLFQFEHLSPLAQWCNLESVDPAWLRRNLVISGVNLFAMRSPFRHMQLIWRIGDDVRIELTGPCDPCSRMEEALGPGGFNAMRGMGGLCARIVAGGRFAIGDAVQAIDLQDDLFSTEGTD